MTMQHGLYPEREPGTASIGDYEDFTAMALDPGELKALVAGAGECVFSWTTSQGFPVGVVMAYVYRHGRFWTNCIAQRKRVAALRARPQAAVVVNKDGKMATYKGNAVIHSPGDDDWDHVKSWFYAALSGAERDPGNPFLRRVQAFLDGPHQVIIEMPAQLVLSFDFGKFSLLTQAAIGSVASPASADGEMG
jgi:hypothetical protein